MTSLENNRYSKEKTVVDISHHNNDINFDEARKHVGYFIARTSDGDGTYGTKDRKYKKFTDEMSSKGIPFGNYMFNRFVSVADAINEANYFWSIGNKNATSWVCDAEVTTAPNMQECIQAFVNRLRELGAKKVGLYVGHHKYEEFGAKNIKNIDFVWIPRYGKQPNFTCDLWQWTEYGNIPGIGKCDINVIQNGKDLSVFGVGQAQDQGQGQGQQQGKKPYDSSWFTKQNGVFTADRAIKVRRVPGVNEDHVRTLQAGGEFNYNGFCKESHGYVWLRGVDGTFVASGESLNGVRQNYWGSFR